MNKNISLFSIICLTLNSIIIKIFIYPLNLFSKDLGSGAFFSLCLSTVLAITLILLAYVLRHKIKEIVNFSGVKLILVLYHIMVSVYVLVKTTHILSMVYPAMNTVIIFISLFIVAIYISSRGFWTIQKIHLCFVPPIIVFTFMLPLGGLKYTDFFNIYPIFGSGLTHIFLASLKHLFVYLDIILPCLLLFFSEKTISKRQGKCILLSSFFGIILYAVLASIYFFVNTPNTMLGFSQPAMYFLSKLSVLGRLNIRFDALYIVTVTLTSMLFVASAFYVTMCLTRSVFPIKAKINTRHLALLFLFIISAFLLCGCESHKEVENSAYSIAIGIDKTDDEGLNFTFQFSNPLSNGADINDENDENDETEDNTKNDKQDDKKNKSVDNINVTAPNFFSAMTLINDHMGKTPSFSHVKLVVLSGDIVFSSNAQSIYDICSDILKTNSVNQEASLCVTSSLTAHEYLTGINPSLEESTARHYELMFDKKSTYNSLNTSLLKFTTMLGDSSCCAYAPSVTESGFYGSVIFSSDKNIGINSNDSQILNLILGNTSNTDIFYTDENNNQYYLSTKNCPKIHIKPTDKSYADIFITVYIKTLNNTAYDTAYLTDELNEKINSLLKYLYSNNCDILKIGKDIRKTLKYEKEWTDFSMNTPPSMYNLNVALTVK